MQATAQACMSVRGPAMQAIKNSIFKGFRASEDAPVGCAMYDTEVAFLQDNANVLLDGALHAWILCVSYVLR